jgi:VIT1/CCC1 family predicted Fe2+/Mn2+ transporter
MALIRSNASEYHERIDPHARGSRLSDVILGGQDGLVNVLGVVLGVAAATSDARVVLAAGLAGGFAESISMAAVAFTSAQARRALYESEVAREQRHVRAVPELEREEIRALYRQKGFEGELLDRVVETITADPDVWVAVMMAEEIRLAAEPHGSALRGAGVVGFASLLGSALPLLPFIVFSARTAAWAATTLAALALFALGAYKARVTVGRWWKSGAELAAIGIVSAIGGYAVGAAFHVVAP